METHTQKHFFFVLYFLLLPPLLLTFVTSITWRCASGNSEGLLPPFTFSSTNPSSCHTSTHTLHRFLSVIHLSVNHSTLKLGTIWKATCAHTDICTAQRTHLNIHHHHHTGRTSWAQRCCSPVVSIKREESVFFSFIQTEHLMT